LTAEPPEAPLYPIPKLRVGVTGHRSEGLVEADTDRLRQQIRRILLRAKESAQGPCDSGFKGAGGSSLPRIISPLAEGTDRMVAAEGLAAGYELYCPLPFPQEEYEKDFRSLASIDEFRRLLAQAACVCVLGGASETQAQRNASYAAVGREVLRRCDILLAVWDGNPAKGSGGTAQIVREADEGGIPVVWVHSKRPHPVRVLHPKNPCRKELPSAFVEILTRLLS
jgi:hypothetical protein